MLKVQAGEWLGEELAPRTFLEAQAGTDDLPQGVPVPLLGQGIAVLLTPGAGLTHLWELDSGEAAPTTVLEWLYSGMEGPWAMSARGLSCTQDGSFTWSRSGWSRVTRVAGATADTALEEVGLLFRDGPVVVVQHRWLGAPPPELPRGPRVRVLGPGHAVEAALPLLLPLRARQRQAAEGGWGSESTPLPGQGEAVQVQTDLAWGKTLRQALEIVESAAVAPHFLGGVEPRSQGSRPVLLAGDALAELGLALVLMGEIHKAWAALDSLLQHADAPPPRTLLLLAARWALATGDPSPLLPFRNRLDMAASSTLEQSFSPGGERWGGRALPPPTAVLEELATAVEPLGKDGWAGALRRLIREHRRSPPELQMNPLGGVTLPVLGTPSALPITPPEPPSLETDDILLPTPASFASPMLAVFLPRRTLQAARLVRSVLEGMLGVKVEGALGRMSLAPKLPADMAHLRVSGLGVAGARVAFNYRRADGVHTFHLLQTEGGIPVNLTLRVTLEGMPAHSRMEVTMGGEPVEVEVFTSNGQWGFQLQFPLDPERRLRVVSVERNP
ncbi:MAG: hypothetical protein WEA09_14755 [Gemmatimonadota bacterium]